MRSIATEYSPATQSGDTRPPMETAIRNGYRPRPATVEKSREIRESAGHFIAGQGLWRFNMQALARHLRLLLPTLC